jgi:hypothetical protein
MKSVLLDLTTVEETVKCLATAAGEIEYSIELLEEKLSADDFINYKKMAGKVIFAIHSGLIDPVLEEFPDMRKSLYGDSESKG